MAEKIENSAPAPADDKPRSGLLRQVREIAILLLVIFTVKACIVDQYSIPSGSMEPTLHGNENMFLGDRVLTNKLLFGPRIPFTTIRLMDWWEPQRWDIVVFKPPAGGSEHPRLIKRIVGLPGERVQLKDGKLLINGEVVPFGKTLPKDFEGYWGYAEIERASRLAPEPEARAAFTQMLQKYPPKYGCLPGDEYQIVPEGHYFMLGDNSLNSVDGRMYGWVPRENLYGRASAVFWPIGHARDFTGFSHTWWGKLLLFGIPTLIVGFEVRQWRKERAEKKAKAK
jgi:signal peptidase I